MANFVEWASFSIPDLSEYGDIPLPTTDEDWKIWASDVVSIDGISSLGAPSPFDFGDWRDWAARLIEVLNDGF
jgi:hypothetical protein